MMVDAGDALRSTGLQMSPLASLVRDLCSVIADRSRPKDQMRQDPRASSSVVGDPLSSPTLRYARNGGGIGDRNLHYRRLLGLEAGDPSDPGKLRVANNLYPTCQAWWPGHVCRTPFALLQQPPIVIGGVFTRLLTFTILRRPRLLHQFGFRVTDYVHTDLTLTDMIVK